MISLQPTNIHEPLSYDIGDDWFLDFSCNDARGNPLDLTGATIEWKLTRIRDGAEIFVFTVNNGITIGLAPSTNVPPSDCTVHVLPAQTAPLEPGDYRDRLRVVTFESIVTTQAVGRITAIVV